MIQHTSPAQQESGRSHAVNTAAIWRARALWWLLAAAALAAVVLIGVYQVRPTYGFTVGDPPHDRPFVENFNQPERQPAQFGGRRFRWTREDGTIDVPGIGRQAVVVDIVLAKSSNPQPDVQILANGTSVGTFQLTNDFASYHIAVPASLMNHGTLTLTIVPHPFSVPGDRRVLGVPVGQVTVTPTGSGIVLPPARIAFSLWFGILCVALALLIAGFGGVGAFVGGVSATIAMAAFLIGNRLFLTVAAGAIVRAGLLTIAVVALVRFLVPPLCRRIGMPTTARDVRWLAAIAAVVLAVRFGGMLHPDMVVVDLPFHLHRLEDVVDRHMLLLNTQAEEFQDHTSYYLPTPYLLLWPLTLLIHDRTLLFFLFLVTIDLARFCVLWVAARLLTRDLLAANLTVLTMALVPVGWIVYSWGSFPNMFGELLMTLLFVALIFGYRHLAGPHRWRWFALFAVLLLVTLLAHNGVLVEAAMTVAFSLAVRVVQNIRARTYPWAGGVLPLAGAGFVAAALAFVIFYRIPLHALLTEQYAPKKVVVIHGYRTGGATPDDTIGLPAYTIKNFGAALAVETGEISYAFYRVWPILALLIGLALLARRPVGWPLRRHGAAMDAGEAGSEHDGDTGPPNMLERSPHAGDAALTLSIWLVVAVILLVVGLITRFYVRYPLYLLPAVALGAGIALAALVRRVAWGRYAAALLLAASAVTTLLLWYDRIVYAYK